MCLISKFNRMFKFYHSPEDIAEELQNQSMATRDQLIAVLVYQILQLNEELQTLKTKVEIK